MARLRFLLIPIILCVFFFGPSTLAAKAAMCDEPIMTEAGALVGQWSQDRQTCVWRGVPYAAPPVDELRWRPPQNSSPWRGIKSTEEFQPRCLQKGIMELVNFDPSGSKSEDCLYANIWRPAKPAKALPVMVFFHGGALFGGTANTPMYHGELFSERGDVILVTVNYRLAVFGYLSTEALAQEDANGSAGNYGVMDQIQALKWVQSNIESFGGDPNNVTIFGESAGGWSVCSILASPLTKGLYHRAIMESAGCRAVTSKARGYEHGAQIAQRLGCEADDLQCLRSISSRRLLRRGIRPVWNGFSWLPRIDDYVLTGVPADVLASGDVQSVPLIAGNNRDEANIVAALIPSHLSRSESVRTRLYDSRFGVTPKGEIQQLYAKAGSGNSINLFAQQFTDTALLCPTLEGVRSVGKTQDQTWVYRFDFTRYRFGSIVGAAHGLELPFVFGTLDKLPVWPLYGIRHRGAAWSVSEHMMDRWALFAHTGSPNGPELPEWPTFKTVDSVQVFDVTSRVETLNRDQIERCDYWVAHVRANPWMAETLGLLSPANVPGLFD